MIILSPQSIKKQGFIVAVTETSGRLKGLVMLTATRDKDVKYDLFNKIWYIEECTQTYFSANSCALNFLRILEKFSMQGIVAIYTVDGMKLVKQISTDGISKEFNV